MRRVLVAAAISFFAALPAQAANWVKVDGSLSFDAESLFTDSGGYTLFKTRELEANGAVKYKHKEAIHCGNSKHFFRAMFGATATVNNRLDADEWKDWKTNSREAYNIDRLYALKTVVCKLKK